MDMNRRGRENRDGNVRHFGTNCHRKKLQKVGKKLQVGFWQAYLKKKRKFLGRTKGIKEKHFF